MANILTEAWLGLQALIAHRHLTTGKFPSIDDVRSLLPELAQRMQDLGYAELTPELARAFLRTETKLQPATDKEFLFVGDDWRQLKQVTYAAC